VSKPNDRRCSCPEDDEPLSAELVALLLVCGGEVRESDRELLDGSQDRDPFDRRRPDRRRYEAA
jgi:hypothetical protein